MPSPWAVKEVKRGLKRCRPNNAERLQKKRFQSDGEKISKPNDELLLEIKEEIMSVFLRGKIWHYAFQGRTKYIQRTTRQSDKKVAEIMEAKARIMDAKGEIESKESDITLHQLFDIYLHKHKKKPSYPSKKVSLKLIEEFFGGKKKMREVREEEIDKLIKYFEDERDNKGSTINKNIGAFRHCFHLYKNRFEFKNNPFSNFKASSEKKNQRMRFLLEHEKARLLSLFGNFMAKVVSFCLQTGIRQGEMRNLKWLDLDFKNKTILIRAGEEDDNRYIPMTEDVIEILESLSHCCEYVFCYNRKQLSRDGILKSGWQQVIKLSGIKDFHFHDLRHTFATDYLAKNRSADAIRALQEILGHKNISQTMKYAHVMPGIKVQQMANIPRCLYYTNATVRNTENGKIEDFIENQLFRSEAER